MEGLSESQEEEARHLVETHPDLIRNSEEAEAVGPLFQNKRFPGFPRDIVMGMTRARKRSRSRGSSSRGCFGYESLVTTGSGEQKLMRDLKIGDEVVSDQTGTWTEFVGWIQLERNNRFKFLEIQTED